jgi:hypothetical protein
MFYILTEFDAQGFHIVGYFSKVNYSIETKESFVSLSRIKNQVKIIIYHVF